MRKIDKLIAKLNIMPEILTSYGEDIFKIDAEKMAKNPKKGKLILMTAINPTSAGEGKTTCAIGLADALNSLGMKTILTLREPSMGPVFGSKGTATGGGECVLEPSARINLHFTGDLHVITAANNFVAAAIDSHIYWGNKLAIDLNQIWWNRCLDVNDRALRDTEIKIKKGIVRKESFVITAACKMMIILSLAKNTEDLRKRLEETVFALNESGKPLTLDMLNVVGSLMAILSDAIKPNLVFSKYETPALLHCGPFANIATGTNSLIATNLGLKLADFVVTESGFSTELGFQKYIDVIGAQSDLKPDCVVLVVTIRALKEKNEFENQFCQLKQHLQNVLQITKHLVVTINEIAGDDPDDVQVLKVFLDNQQVKVVMNNAFFNGPTGASDLAKTVAEICQKENDVKAVIKNLKDAQQKMIATAKNYYGLNEITFSNAAKEDLAMIRKLNPAWYETYPVVIAKSPVTLDGNDKNTPEYIMQIQHCEVNTGAQFILALTNKVLMMPGLPENGNFTKIDLVDGQVVNLK